MRTLRAARAVDAQKDARIELRNGASMTCGRSYRAQLRRVLGLEGD